MNSSRTRQAPALLLLAFLALLVVLSTAVGSAGADPSVQSKRAQAQAVLAQIAEVDTQLEKVIESYNAATDELGQIDTDLVSNARHLVVAEQSLATAQAHLAERLKALYVNGDSGGALEVLLGAEDLDDLLGRIDMVQRVGDQDAKVLGDVKQFGKEVSSRRARLKVARKSQNQVVAERASQKRYIEGQLAERQRMLAGIQDEITKLQAEEARRQEQLAAEARARFAQQRSVAALSRTQLADIVAPTAALDSGASDDITPSAPPSQYGGVVGLAMQELGKPYVWAAAGPNSFDCSGLVQYVYAQVGVSLPHNAAAMYSYGTPVAYDDLEPGDLVFFSGLGHMGIYIGGGQYIHAPQTGDVVKISSVAGHGSWVGARRL